MDKLSLCRICLVENVRMYVVASRQLQETFEKLTDVPFITEDRPMLACFFCYAKLKHCSQFHRKCMEAENVLAQMLRRDYELKHKEFSDIEYFGGLKRTPITHLNIGTRHGTEVVESDLKQENVTEQETIQDKYLELEIFPYNHSDSEDTLSIINTEVEDVVLQKKQDNELKGTPASNKLNIRNEQFGDTTPIKQKKNRHDTNNLLQSDEFKNHTTNESNTKMEENVSDDLTGDITREARIKCVVCHRYFTKNSLKTHNCTNKGEKKIECDICSHCFSSKNYLLIHSRLHTGEKPYKCQLCQRTFAQNSALKIHILKHSSEKPYKCDLCNDSFAEKRILKTHILSHTGEKPYKCNLCQQRFTERRNLQRHLRAHSGVKPYECNICQQRFTQKKSLNIHNRKHTGEKPYNCDICQQRFTQKSYLKIHILSHTGERPYKCHICHHGFTQKSNLNIHIRKHTNENCFKCDLCEQSFVESSRLNIHLRKHTGEKPYKCDVCQRSFSVKSNLNRHIRKHNKINI